MDGQHTHGHDGGPPVSLIPIIVGIGILLIVGPTVAGIVIELVHILVIALVTLIIVAGAGGVALLWWRFHTHKIEPPWKRESVTQPPKRATIEGIQHDQLRDAMRLAIEDVLEEERRRRR